MRTFDFRMSGAELIAGRLSWVVEAIPLANRMPRCGDLKTLSKFHIWIDQVEFRWARLEGDNIAPIAGPLWPQRQSAGQLHMTSEQTRYGEGLWLRTREESKMKIKTMILSFPSEITITFSGYRKFQADSQIVPVEGK